MEEPLDPPPTYTIPVVCLLVGCGFGAMESYLIAFQSRVEVTWLFVFPGALLLGLAGLYDPRIPASLQPNARGYPRWTKRIANGCWVLSVLIGTILYWAFVGF